MLLRSPHPRYPDLRERSGSIVGMIHIKDVMRLLLNEETLAAITRAPVPLVPRPPLDSVLTTMRREKTQMAVVIDEHGGTSGVVTLDDLFEEVVGEIEEGPASAPQVYRDARGRLRVPVRCAWTSSASSSNRARTRGRGQRERVGADAARPSAGFGDQCGTIGWCSKSRRSKALASTNALYRSCPRVTDRGSSNSGVTRHPSLRSTQLPRAA